MNVFLRTCCVGFLALASLAEAQTAQVTAGSVPVTVEYYYRIKWGSAGEFLRLYKKNHAPLLEEMKKHGFIRSIRVDEPFTHLAGGPRWDLRVTIVFRDAAAAMPDPQWDKQWEAARFSLLEDHWDVVNNEVAQ
jgi:hypothetical protein